MLKVVFGRKSEVQMRAEEVELVLLDEMLDQGSWICRNGRTFYSSFFPPLTIKLVFILISTTGNLQPNEKG
jgi:hypothetical protein